MGELPKDCTEWKDPDTKEKNGIKMVLDPMNTTL